jgi:hypothetical protein
VPLCVLDGFSEIRATLLEGMAGTMRLELATSAVTATGRFAMSISRRKPGLAIQRLGSRLHRFQEGLESTVGL